MAMIRASFSSSRVACKIPGMHYNEQEHVRDQILERYTSRTLKRTGKGIAIIWFRNDLRVLDNEALLRAWTFSDKILPVYCVDPRLFQKTHYFGFPKTGALRAQFLKECVEDLKNNLIKKGLNLLIRHGKPEDILPNLAREFTANTIYAHKETCSEELKVEKLLRNALEGMKVTDHKKPQLQLLWGSTLYHLDDLPFDARNLPDVYTQFRKSVEMKSTIRGCFKLPLSLGPAPDVKDWGSFPSLEQLGLNPLQESLLNLFHIFVAEVPIFYLQIVKGLGFSGGETAALSRLHEYFWEKDLLKVYKQTRNGMLGSDYSTKFSPWLASGSISPRFIYEEVKRYENQRGANDSSYWVLFELIWRDYFRFLSIKCGNSIFHPGGPRNVQKKWSQDKQLLDTWITGTTGYPLIDANMKELSATGFMSNRGRQIVCSFLVRDMGVDWRMGAEWFESILLDYDPSSNYGNWTYGAGVGNDPREDRYFSIPKQAQTYDPDGEYVAFWLPQLQKLANGKRHFPGKAYMEPVVPLKHGSVARHDGKGKERVPPFRR